MGIKPTNKMKAWLRAYLNESNPKTFLNASASARASGYKGKDNNSFNVIGFANYQKFKPKIIQWLDDHGFSEDRLKIKLLQLIDARQTIYQKVKGAVKQEDLPEGYRLVTVSGSLAYDKDGNEVFGDGNALIEINMESIETQRRSLDMALKMKGMYAPEKHEHAGKDGKPIEYDHTIKAEMNLGALADAIKRTESE